MASLSRSGRVFQKLGVSHESGTPFFRGPEPLLRGTPFWNPKASKIGPPQMAHKDAQGCPSRNGQHHHPHRSGECGHHHAQHHHQSLIQLHHQHSASRSLTQLRYRHCSTRRSLSQFHQRGSPTQNLARTSTSFGCFTTTSRQQTKCIVLTWSLSQLHQRGSPTQYSAWSRTTSRAWRPQSCRMLP